MNWLDVMHGLHHPLTAKQLQEILNEYVGLILMAHRQLDDAVKVLANLPRPQQDWVVEWVRVVSRQNMELAYEFIHQVAYALTLMDENGVEEWITAVIETYDKEGLNKALDQLNALGQFAQQYRLNNMGLPLVQIQSVLQHFIIGLDGRALKMEHGDVAFTDTETLFLPASIHRFDDKTLNFLLYKATAAHLWAQTWFGTWQLSLITASEQFPHREKAIRLFHTLERLRLDACIARELSGLHRDMQRLLQLLNEPVIPTGWETIAARLAEPNATVEDSYFILNEIHTWAVPEPVAYQGVLLPEQVERVINLRKVHEKKALQNALAELLHKHPEQPQNTDDGAQLNAQPMIEQQPTLTERTLQNLLTMQGEGAPNIPELQDIIASIKQDYGEIPPDYWLIPAGAGQGEPDFLNPEKKHRDLADTAQQIFSYPEWNYQRQRYHKDWCSLREVDVALKQDNFIQETRCKYKGLLANLRRTFEALRGGNQWQRRQSYGEDIDLEALITAYTDAQAGHEMSQRVFTHLRRVERDIAVMLMIDMSGSTKGWINLAERESLVLLCDVLELLGDRYAIYGFSGATRKRCEIFPIKRFDEPYNTTVQQRISGISAQEYTRMGVAIRHLTHCLSEVDAHIRLLITLSDGRPDDEGENYRGVYGLEDTRQALLEAKKIGIHPFCITIDSQAKTYLPYMYGVVNYAVIDKVEQLPMKVADVYRRLTT
ncbi:nitric oxide reductase activation protein NorD [Beggiatoa leptomitoformis]|uniref:Nitric oxide reductase activation protein NorD n=1 Tax=Beggiatoa leptomitoformis TaxID=288004 RepID=A0A2N9YJK1_9GAMM|nr:nitric oxide reductase activation protein NorD [Beggiatoa leptomitoformis]ALG69441.2 nitric oxide reductase activation protein NorD [Beggiatoa leptomitoformis]AUI70644.2 nitric oxide reductase activation protein NorD [Beggiatoa leptomitoformis]